MTDLTGFADPNKTVEIDDDSEEKSKKKIKKSGGFQSMGLNFNLLKGVQRRGYKIPTPIQRKAIPLVQEGRDVVAMARTGSGKTACFLIPMFEKLKTRCAKTGARAIILSPTRELALQTLKFIKEIGRFLDFKAAVILGGDSMTDQFSVIHGNPDIIVATPGRLLHVCVEMDLKLSSVEYIVFDEADRLFEMGFGEQLNEIVNRLPDTRQTLLFSATLPKVLVEFAKAGLSDPVLLRLDVESKLPSELQLWFITVRPEERIAALLVLLKNHIDLEQQTVVFAATKHHVEYIHMILDAVGITNTYIYSNLDPSARKIHAAKFVQGIVKVLVVTDVAARGIDIPKLDNVINFHFPAKSKLFVHRVGRCARAGRSGTAYSLAGPDEFSYLIDLHLFLNKPIYLATPTNKKGATVGRIPQSLIEEQHCTLLTLFENRTDIVSMKKVSENGYLQYLKSRPNASVESNRKVKQTNMGNCAVHPIFDEADDERNENDRENVLDKMKLYRPQGTIFEICSKNKSQDYIMMKQKRVLHKDNIEAHHQKSKTVDHFIAKPEVNLPSSNNDEIENTFKEIILPKKRRIDDLYKPKNKKMKVTKDENYIPYTPTDKHTEEGLAVNNFQHEANKVQFELTGDSADALNQKRQQIKWDRKKKKLITVNPNSKVGKIKTESGVWISSTFKTNRYNEWKEQMKITDNKDDSDDDDNKSKGMEKRIPHTHWAKHNEKMKKKGTKSEFKTSDQIVKARMQAQKMKKKNHKKKGSKKKGKRN